LALKTLTKDKKKSESQEVRISPKEKLRKGKNALLRTAILPKFVL